MQIAQGKPIKSFKMNELITQPVEPFEAGNFPTNEDKRRTV